MNRDDWTQFAALNTAMQDLERREREVIRRSVLRMVKYLGIGFVIGAVLVFGWAAL